MAENKKSFIMYVDLVSVIEKLPLDVAGKLFRIILDYVNDKSPEVDDLLLQVAFEPIKNQLKRDLKKWSGTKEERVKSGKLGGLKSGEARKIKKQKEANEANASKSKQKEANEANEANASKSKQKEANEAVTVNVTVNDNVKEIRERKLKFASTLTPFVEKYGKDVVTDFYLYWTEPNKSNTKFRQELEKTWDTKRRIEKWASNNFNKITTKTTKGAVSVQPAN